MKFSLKFMQAAPVPPTPHPESPPTGGVAAFPVRAPVPDGSSSPISAPNHRPPVRGNFAAMPSKSAGKAKLFHWPNTKTDWSINNSSSAYDDHRGAPETAHVPIR